MTTRRIVAIIAAFGVSAVCAEGYVDRADANGDGYVSLHELRAAHYADPEFNKRIEQSFADYDRDGDGLISESERQSARARTEAAKSSTLTDTRAADADAQRYRDEAPGAITATDVSASSGEVLDHGNDRRRTERSDGSLSRTELWIQEIDTDNSGGASIAELVASGDGQQWFTERAFNAADRNGDQDLDAAELAELVRSLERRPR